MERSLVHELLKPQFELITALSGLSMEVSRRRNFYDRHHNFWPRSQYTTKIERDFRGIFIVRGIWRPIHDELHATIKPPEKPTVQEMKDIVEQYREQAIDMEAYVEYAV